METVFDNKQEFVGAYLPPGLFNFLRLYCARENTSMNNLVLQTFSELYTEENERKVLSDIVDQAERTWNEKKETTSPEDYLKEVELILAKKKLAAHHISILCEEIEMRIKT